MDRLEQRVFRLERANRRLLGLWGLTIAAAVAMGAQTANNLVRARRIELVDEQGIPLATLAPARNGNGGELTLRDREGERRVYLTAEPGSGTLNLQGGKADDPAGTAGLRADGDGATLGLIGSKASASVSVRKDRSKIATTDAQGRETFAAPWK